MKTIVATTATATATEKLISELLRHSIVTPGEISVNADGIVYRYDRVVLKYPHAAYWLIKLFNAAAEENNAKHRKHFSNGDCSFFFDRALYKGQKDGKISFSQLVIL